MILRFHPGATAEHVANVRRYESIHAGLGAEYLADFSITLELLLEDPERHRIERPPDIRLIRLRRFPYRVVYRQMNGRTETLNLTESLAHDRFAG